MSILVQIGFDSVSIFKFGYHKLTLSETKGRKTSEYATVIKQAIGKNSLLDSDASYRVLKISQINSYSTKR